MAPDTKTAPDPTADAEKRAKAGKGPNVIAARATEHAPGTKLQFPDQSTRRSGYEPFAGHFVTVTGGEHEGAYGVFRQVATSDEGGYPLTVIVEPRDAPNNWLTVAYSDLGPAQPGRLR